MNYICKHHKPPFRWSVSDDVPFGFCESMKICPCGEKGEPDTRPPKKNELKTDLQLACFLLERWISAGTGDTHLIKETMDFLIGDENEI